MYEFSLYNIYTGLDYTIYGYSFEDACRRSEVDTKDMVCYHQEYLD